MKPYGPVNVTINTPFQLGIDSSATVIQVHNNTGLSLRLYFGAAAPASPTYPSQWHATIDPGAHPVLPVNGSQYFDGTLSFYPYSVQGNPTQQFGVISASSFVSVEAYFQSEQPPTSVYSPVFQQGAAQQRVIALPPSSRLITPSASGGVANLLFYDQATASPQRMADIQLQQTHLVLIANQFQSYVNVYLHGIHAKFKATKADTQTELEFTIEARHIGAGGLLKNGPVTIFTSAVTAASHVAAPTTAYGDIISFTPLAPLAQVLTIALGTMQTGDYIALYWVKQNALGNWRFFPNVSWTADLTNQSAVAGYGAANPNPVQPDLGTSATNPQTY